MENKEVKKHILNDPVTYTETFCENARSICEALLYKVVDKRLGFKNGTCYDLHSHPFFSSINWRKLDAGVRFKEGSSFIHSLLTLRQVIKKLSESQKGFTNYRDSKQTRILQNSLGGNAKTVIICLITPNTVDETLSTLQFASAAKRMKNNPSVTVVSDEGALLRRYRNEIVSSVTQTTVTEKETLRQLLQEKDYLQQEQVDRMRNLTKLLVTASNVVQVQKNPKRRMTWGGRFPRSAQSVAEDHESADLSFEPSFKKRRADLTMTEEGREISCCS
ncbi:hypothetical protein AOLI_G00241460 [Acnodon oligacanthus]